MAKTPSKFGFVECADLINAQKYGPALKMFQQAVSNFLESKSAPKRGKVALQLLQISTALEETLKKAFGDKWAAHIPGFSDEGSVASCSFCGKGESEVLKLIAGPSLSMMVKVASDVVTKVPKLGAVSARLTVSSASSVESLVTETVKVLLVSPGLKVRVPEVAV